MVDSHLGETGVRVIVITALEQERETELDLVLTQHLHGMGGKHIYVYFVLRAKVANNFYGKCLSTHAHIILKCMEYQIFDGYTFFILEVFVSEFFPTSNKYRQFNLSLKSYDEPHQKPQKLWRKPC